MKRKLLAIILVALLAFTAVAGTGGARSLATRASDAIYNNIQGWNGTNLFRLTSLANSNNMTATLTWYEHTDKEK